MYGFIWRLLPGPTFVRVLLALLLIAAVVYALFEHVFPWLEPHLPIDDATIGEAG